MKNEIPAGRVDWRGVARWLNPLRDIARSPEESHAHHVVTVVSVHCAFKHFLATEMPDIDDGTAGDDYLRHDLENGRCIAFVHLFEGTAVARCRLKMALAMGIPSFVIYSANMADSVRELLEHPNILHSYALESAEGDLTNLVAALDWALQEVRTRRSTMPSPETAHSSIPHSCG